MVVSFNRQGIDPMANRGTPRLAGKGGPRFRVVDDAASLERAIRQGLLHLMKDRDWADAARRLRAEVLP
jgi:hypothetical protein